MARTLRLDAGETRRSVGKVALGFPATHIAFSWTGSENVKFVYRTDPAGRWLTAPIAHDADTETRHFTGVLAVDRPETLEWDVRRKPGAAVSGVTLDYLNTLDGPRIERTVPSTASAEARTPNIITRAEWGADESLKHTSGGCRRQFHPMRQRLAVAGMLMAIAAFVRSDPDRARELLLEFADFTRYSFRQAGEFTTLAEPEREPVPPAQFEIVYEDDRLIVVVGPCSIHDREAALDAHLLGVEVDRADVEVQPAVEHEVRRGAGGLVESDLEGLEQRQRGERARQQLEGRIKRVLGLERSLADNTGLLWENFLSTAT